MPQIDTDDRRHIRVRARRGPPSLMPRACSGIPIPTLCHQQNENPVGVCRVCVVDVGQRVYAASCIRQAEPGMTVKTNTEPVQRRSQHSARAADGRPSQSVRSPAAFGRLRTGTAGGQAAESRSRAFPTARRRADMTILRSPLRSITRPASCATAAFAAATTSATTGCWRGAGKGYQAGIAFDNNLPMGESVVRLLRRVHGVVPHRRADQSSSRQSQAGRRDQVNPPISCSDCRFSRMFRERFSNLNQPMPSWSAHFRAGDIICREGEFGATAFYILDGTVDVYLSSADRPRQHRRRYHAGLPQQAEEPAQLHASDQHAKRKATRRTTFRSMPLSICLIDNPIAELGPGRAVRRDDLHELLPALGHGARQDRLHDARDVAQCSRHHAAQQDLPRATGPHLQAARARFAPAQRSRAGVADAGLHRPSAGARGTASAISAGTSHLHPGRVPPTASIWCGSVS